MATPRSMRGGDPLQKAEKALGDGAAAATKWFDEVIEERCTPSWISMVMFLSAIAYLVMGILYAAGVGLEGYNASTSSAVLPFYYLTSNSSSFNTTGFTSGLLNPVTVGVDYPVVVSTHYAAATTKVEVYSHTLGLLFTLFAINLIPYLVAKMGGPAGMSTIVPSGRVVFIISLVLTWTFVQTDTMFLLGNNDKAASWLASGVILAQVGLYYVAEMDKSKEFIEAMDKIETKGWWGLSHAILLLALVVGAYLWCMSVGVALLMPLHYAGGIEAIKPAEYKPVVAFLLLTQTVELARFVVVLTGSSAANKNKTYERIANVCKGNAALVFGNMWLFTLVTIYTFLPGSVINHAGRM